VQACTAMRFAGCVAPQRLTTPALLVRQPAAWCGVIVLHFRALSAHEAQDAERRGHSSVQQRQIWM
jgi:hypothetical protein